MNAGIARIVVLRGRARHRDAVRYMLPFRGVTAVTGQSAEQPVALSIGTAAAALGRFDDAEQLYAEAIDLAQRLGAPTFVAATRVQWAKTLLDPAGPQDVTRAKELAQQALATAEELGLGRVAELSRRVLST